eukprot:3299445-Pleurochrysis_carterae.AAC.1
MAVLSAFVIQSTLLKFIPKCVYKLLKLGPRQFSLCFATSGVPLRRALQLWLGREAAGLVSVPVLQDHRQSRREATHLAPHEGQRQARPLTKSARASGSQPRAVSARLRVPTGSNAAAGEHHGCPFRNFDEGQLRAQMQQMQVTGPSVRSLAPPMRIPARLCSCCSLVYASWHLTGPRCRSFPSFVKLPGDY